MAGANNPYLGSEYQQELYRSMVLGEPPPAPTPQMVKDNLYRYLSGLAGGKKAGLSLEDAQKHAGWSQFVQEAQAAGFDPAQLVNQRNKNIRDYETGGTARRVGDWIDRTGLDDLITYGTIAVAGLGGLGGLGVGPFSGGAGAGAGAGVGSGAAGNALAPVSVPDIAAIAPASVAAGGITSAAPLAGAIPAMSAVPSYTFGGGPDGLGISGGNALSTGGPLTLGGAANAAGTLAGGTNTVPEIVKDGLSALDWLNLGGSILSGYMGNEAAKDASDAEAKAYQAAIDEQRRQFDLTRSDFAPYLESGTNALGRLNRASTGDFSDFTASPDYEFVRGEGTRDLGNSFAARGGAFSGNALRALSQYNTGLASREYGNWWNRQAGLAGVGQAATGSVANLGQATAGNVGNLMTGAGSSRASGILGQNAARQNALGGALDAWMFRRNSPIWGY